jgi:putative heme iron utilization protein
MGSEHTSIELKKCCSLCAGTAIPFSLQAPVSTAPQGSTSASARGKRKARCTAKGGCLPKSIKEQACNWTLLEILDMVTAKR